MEGKFWTGLDPSSKLTSTGTAGGAGIITVFMSLDPSQKYKEFQ